MATTNILNFPDVVLAAIFIAFCGDEPVLLPRRTTDRRGILSRVDERWAVVLQSTSTLWADIFFTSPPSFSLRPNALLNELYTCTTRSGNNLLTIAFDMGPHNWVFSIVHAVVLPTIGRIRRLTCPIHTNNDISAFLKIPEGRFSALESIEVAFVDTWDEPISWFDLDTCLEFHVLRTAPQLRNVTAHLFNGLHPIDLHLPWDQLTSLDLASTAMTPEVFVKIIRCGARRLEEGYFHVRFSRLLCPQRVLSQTTVTMDRLQTLRLRLMYPSNDRRLFSILGFPVLHSLTIYMFDRRQHWNVSHYTNLLRASKNTLQQLHLFDFQPPGLRIFRTAQNVQLGYPPLSRQYRHTTHRTLEELFEITPNVESVTLPLGLPIHVRTAEKLATCTLLPRLQVLVLGATIESAQHMLSVLNSRHNYISLGVGRSAEVRHPTEEPSPAIIRSLGLWIPYHLYTFNMALVLDQQSQVLASLGIMVDIHPTTALPLPIA
ncbi:hypothetical protein BJ912DRAFT_1042863 [Pholiota molesta]|nr:hypothetical protein BJ912DRAFT_1042863 [Pholiota molesta]